MDRNPRYRGGLHQPAPHYSQHSDQWHRQHTMLHTTEMGGQLKWQKDASNNKNTSEDFCKTIVAVDNRFVAFVYMVEVCYFLNLFHSGDDVNNETVAFVGDRTESRDPYAVLSTEILP